MTNQRRQEPPPVEESARRVEELLEAGRPEEVRAFLRGFHPADVAEILAELDSATLARAFAIMRPDRAADVLDELDDETYAEILDALGDRQLTTILNELPPDEGADVLVALPRERAAAVMQAMAPEQQGLVRPLVGYAPDTAGGIMSSKVIRVTETEVVLKTEAGHEVRFPRSRVVRFDLARPAVLELADDETQMNDFTRIRDMDFAPFGDAAWLQSHD